MTRPAHTPGPWRVEGPSKVVPNISDGGDYAVLDADGEIIAEAIRKVGVDNYRPAEANAHLIAAAPEGFELIEQLEESFTADGTYQQFLPAMRAYLAKAGDQS